MLHAVETKPIEAVEFRDRLDSLKSDVVLIELAVEGLTEQYNGPESDTAAIVRACWRLYRELGELAQELTPPVSKQEKRRLRALTEKWAERDKRARLADVDRMIEG